MKFIHHENCESINLETVVRIKRTENFISFYTVLVNTNPIQWHFSSSHDCIEIYNKVLKIIESTQI